MTETKPSSSPYSAKIRIKLWDKALSVAPTAEALAKLRLSIGQNIVQPSFQLHAHMESPVYSVKGAISLDPHQITEIMARATSVDQNALPFNLHTWFEVELEDPSIALKSVKYLKDHAAIEMAYILPPPAPPPTEYVWTKDFSVYQAWLADAPYGLGVSNLKATGSLGTGIGFIDIEAGWWAQGTQLLHPDLPSNITEMTRNTYDRRHHGTHILGIILAKHQTEPKGCVGIAPEVGSIRLICSRDQVGQEDIVGALAYACTCTNSGDVVLMEVQAFNIGSTDLVPAEADPLVSQMVRTLTDSQVVVVAAAGNGGVDLDKLEVPAASGIRPFDVNGPDFRDSGAILVGAGIKHGAWQPKVGTGGHIHDGSSNFGARVDCFAQGENLYTPSFQLAAGGGTEPTIGQSSDTSGAAAIIAGAALATQGMAEANPTPTRNGRLSPAQLRELFRNYGTPSQGGIGTMPDLQQIAQQLFP